MRKIEINAAAAVAAVLGLSAVFIDWFRLKANRLVSGEGLSYFDSLGAPLGIVLIVLRIATLALALIQRGKWSSLGLAALSIGVLIAVVPGSGIAARGLVDGAGELARISPSGGFWLSALAVYLLYFAVTRKDQPYRIAISIAVPTILVAAVAFGWLDSFSMIVEYEVQRARFAEELGRHLAIFGASLGAAAIIGLPLGIWASRGKAARPVLYILGVIQTVPSLALFGLLLVTLAAMRDVLPALGISAIGFLPAVIAITLYSLLPIVQHTYSGLSAVAPDICDAGRGWV